MDQGNQYHRFGYQPMEQDSFDQPVYQQRSAGGPANEGLSNRVAGFLKRPFTAITLLVACVGLLSFVIFSSLSGDAGDQPVPVIQADAGPFKTKPDNPGGAEVAHSDSTIFEALDNEMRQDDAPRKVENLLAGASDRKETPGNREEMIAASEKPASEETQSSAGTSPATPSAEVSSAATANPKATDEGQSAMVKPTPRPDSLHKAGASPDTLAFVRSVLDEKDKKSDSDASGQSARAASLIEPAAGTPGPSAGTGGTHFVQLASLQSPDAAAKEMSRLQKSLESVLGQANYRVTRADLGAKGVYYRIQSGPYSEAKARSLCQSIKDQKSGGCLVVR